ncbi:MAG: TM0106 family RecB-like putative nuclease [Bacteroidota bacterium]
MSDYEKTFNELKYSRKLLFSETLSSEKKLIKTKPTGNIFTFKDGIILDPKFSNSNIEIILDGIEFIGKNKIIPILILPFEKITRTDKLFVSLQAAYIQSEFHFQVEHCKIVTGKNLKQTKFRLTSFSKAIKKNINELNKILIQSNHPIFYRNNHCQICEFQNSCLEKLKERDDLSLLTGLKPKEILQKNNRGIFSVKQLSYLFRPKKNPHRKRKFLPELKALAIREEKTFIQEIPNIPTSQNEIFFDIEGVPDRNFYYLIGVIIKTNDLEQAYSFWANNEDEEENIFIEFITLLQSLNEFTIYHYGSYEIQALKRVSKKMSQEYKATMTKIIENSFNLLNIFTHNIYPPTYSNSLKDIARFLKFDWSEKDASGLQSIVWRYNWEMTKNDNLKSKIIQYNLEDCKALPMVKNWIVNIPNNGNENFEKAENIKKESIFRWKRVNFIVKEFNQINHFAYFNYQREKVFIKTYLKIANRQKALNSIKHKIKSSLKPNKIVQFERPRNCPRCNGTVCWKNNKYYRTVIDLKITKTMIRRHIISYHLNRFECGECEHKFYSIESHSIRSKYGHTLSCWIINQSILYMNSFNKISAQLKESFDINFFPSNVSTVKSKYSNFYKFTFDEIIEQVKTSNLIHIDETTFKIKDGSSCYVWVFTNIDSVFYLFRPTRESDFLKVLLVDFKGVLISDFYAGYDAVNCPKQRCLIHLIRDLNDDLVKHQLDNDFKIIVLNFSKLLDEIVSTINKYGLKKRNLNKHKKGVDYFFNSLEKMDFETEICIKWQKRFNSYKDELFTFLDYDGVPWNNNNAEAAIKAVALYRREADGLVTIKRIQENLTLLSIQQTCKYRGINFLNFLLSGEKSIFAYEKL